MLIDWLQKTIDSVNTSSEEITIHSKSTNVICARVGKRHYQLRFYKSRGKYFIKQRNNYHNQVYSQPSVSEITAVEYAWVKLLHNNGFFLLSNRRSVDDFRKEKMFDYKIRCELTLQKSFNEQIRNELGL